MDAAISATQMACPEKGSLSWNEPRGHSSPDGCSAVGRRAGTIYLDRDDSGGDWLVSSSAPRQIKSPINSSTLTHTNNPPFFNRRHLPAGARRYAARSIGGKARASLTNVVVSDHLHSLSIGGVWLLSTVTTPSDRPGVISSDSPYTLRIAAHWALVASSARTQFRTIDQLLPKSRSKTLSRHDRSMFHGVRGS